MVSSSLGIKRHCQSCGKNFYDLDKTPIVCPNCQTTFDPEVLLKSSRVKATIQPVAQAADAKKDKEVDADLTEDIDAVNDDINNDDDMLDDDSDIAAITSSDMSDEEDIETVSSDDGLEGELDATDDED